MKPSELADALRLASITADLMYAGYSAQCEKIEALEKELAARPTELAHLQACRALDHWRDEAHRLAIRLGVEPVPMPKRSIE